MKVLITGASGFIGRQVLKELKQAGISTIVIGRIKPINYIGEFIEADLLTIRCYRDLLKNTGASHLIHLAWYAEHNKYWTSPVNIRWVEATLRIIEAFCLADGKHIVIAGTCAEYDWSYGYCSEITTPINPSTLYGVAKDATRRMAFAICAKYQVKCAWGRIFMAYGANEDSRRLIPALIEVFEGKRLPFGVNASSFRDFLNVKDISTAFLVLLKNNTGGVFNICSSQPVQVSEIVKLLAKSRNANPKMVLDLASARMDEPTLLIGENKSLIQLGWNVKHSINELSTKDFENK